VFWNSVFLDLKPEDAVILSGRQVDYV